jgi:hypothetical protein
MEQGMIGPGQIGTRIVRLVVRAVGLPVPHPEGRAWRASSPGREESR